MKKLDAYSSENKSEQQKNLLRVAVEYTGMEIAIQRELEQIKLKYPDYQLLIYGEAKQHILELLKRDTVDIALLSGITPCSEFHYTVKEYAAEPHPTESAEVCGTRLSTQISARPDMRAYPSLRTLARCLINLLACRSTQVD